MLSNSSPGSGLLSQSTMPMSNTVKFNLINEKAELQETSNIIEFLKNSNIMGFGKKYNIISIIGSQSSGKSTLLNFLFGTNFDILSSQLQRAQTTKGIWMSLDASAPLIILDVEGSDSKERWDERNFYEQSTALFALSLSQVLIINIWTQEVGRFSGSQYGILKVIMEMNIKLFNQDSVKEIVFVLRDFSDDDENTDFIFNTILNDVDKIWAEIVKPPQLQNCKASALFSIKFFTLSHFKFDKKKFLEGIQNMRNSFTLPEAQNFMFRDFNYDCNLPVDGMPLYAEKIWGVIKNHKDLNLPSQKVMVSNLRCSQIKMDAIELIKEDLAQLKSRTLKEINHEFGPQGRKMLDKALEYFEENARDYSKEVFIEKKQDLKKSVLGDLMQVYEVQIHNLKKQLFADFTKKLDKLSLEKGNISEVIKVLKEDKGAALNFAESVLFKSVVMEGEWSMEETMDEIKETLDNQEKGYIEKLVTLFIKYKESQIKKVLTKHVNSLFDSLEPNFWSKVREAFRENMENSEKEILVILKGSFEMKENVAENYLKLIADEVYGSLEYELSSKTSDLNHYLNKRFKNEFSRTEKGTPRNWRIVDEEEIEEIFVDAKDKVVALLNMFKFYEVSKDYKNLSIDSFHEPENERSPLLSEQEFQKISLKLSDDTDNEYKEALRKHNAKESGGVSKWFWLLMLFFAYDDILRWMGSWYLLYPLMMAFSFIGFSYAIGYKDLPGILVGAAQKQFNSLVGKHAMSMAVKVGLK